METENGKWKAEIGLASLARTKWIRTITTPPFVFV